MCSSALVLLLSSPDTPSPFLSPLLSPLLPPLQPHIRTPGYIFGCIGEVVAVAGVFKDASLIAFREEGPVQPLYRVAFSQPEVWHNAGLAYTGASNDRIVVEISQPWLSVTVRGCDTV